MATIDTNLDKISGNIDFSEYFLSLYKNEYVAMTKEETYALINKAQNGDKEAFDTVLLCNLALAIKYAYQFSYACEVEDLIQQGILGLINAINHFDTSTDYAFSTYAWHWIRQSIVRYIDECGSPIRKPVHIKDRLRKYKKIMNDFPGNNYEDEYIFDDKLQFALEHDAVKTKNEFIAMEDMLKNEHIFSLDYQKDDEDGEIDCLLNLLEDTTINIEDDFLRKQKIEDIFDIMEKYLSETQFEVLKMRCGLEPYLEPMTLREIGTKMNISRERVRQIQNRAIEIIKQKGFRYF